MVGPFARLYRHCDEERIAAACPVALPGSEGGILALEVDRAEEQEDDERGPPRQGDCLVNLIVATGRTLPFTTKCRVAARDVGFLGLVLRSDAL